MTLGEDVVEDTEFGVASGCMFEGGRVVSDRGVNVREGSIMKRGRGIYLSGYVSSKGHRINCLSNRNHQFIYIVR